MRASGDPRVELGGELLTWFNPPPRSWFEGEQLSVETASGSDFWQRTHYGFQVDNGHALLTELTRDFRLEVHVEFQPLHQYDQAGLLVRLSENCWLKTSIEYELDEPSRLGSVVTNRGWSDWATQNVPAALRQARFRIARHAGDYLLEYASESGLWTQLRLAHLEEDDGSAPIRAGIYACSPKGEGFRATFRSLRIDRS